MGDKEAAFDILTHYSTPHQRRHALGEWMRKSHLLASAELRALMGHPKTFFADVAKCAPNLRERMGIARQQNLTRARAARAAALFEQFGRNVLLRMRHLHLRFEPHMPSVCASTCVGRCPAPRPFWCGGLRSGSEREGSSRAPSLLSCWLA